MKNEEKINFEEMGRILSGEQPASAKTGQDNELSDIWNLSGTYKYGTEQSDSASWNTLKERLVATPVVRVSWIRRHAVAVAASVALLATAGATFWLLSPKAAASYSVISGVNETKKVSLADGSIVTLSSNSKLVVNEGFNEDVRTVVLTGGANFEIAKNEELPFEVTAGATHTKVLGTGFDILAYPGEIVQIRVNHGKVAFYNKPEKQLLLLKGEGGTYDVAADKLLLQESNANTALFQQESWVFKKTKLADIARLFEHRFSKKLNYDKKDADRMFTGKFDSQASAEEIVSTLKMALQINLTIE